MYTLRTLLAHVRGLFATPVVPRKDYGKVYLPLSGADIDIGSYVADEDARVFEVFWIGDIGGTSMFFAKDGDDVVYGDALTGRLDWKGSTL